MTKEDKMDYGKTNEYLSLGENNQLDERYRVRSFFASQSELEKAMAPRSLRLSRKITRLAKGILIFAAT